MITWTRTQDGEYNGRPCYEYNFVDGYVTYSIVWAYDAGFGISIFDHDKGLYLTNHHGISWRHTLKSCKAYAEEIYAKNHQKVAA